MNGSRQGRLARSGAVGGLVRRALGVLTAATLVVAGAPVVLAAPPRPAPGRTQPTTPAPPSKLPTAPSGPRGGPQDPELSGDEFSALPHNVCRKQPRGAKFTITLPREAELQDLLNWMMTISCQKFILDPKVRSGKITILSPEPVTVEEGYAAFYAALEQMGLTVEPSGDYFKIVETTGVEGRTVPVYGPDARAPDNARFVTQLFRAQSGKTKDIVDVISKLKSKQGSVQTVGDMIIITDTGSQIRRLMRIVRQVDDPSVTREKIFFYQLRYADPQEVADILREIFGEGQARSGGAGAQRGGRGQPQAAGAAGGAEPTFSRVIVDERTGTLIIVAEENDYNVIRRLIEQLDVPLAGTGSDRIHVVKLKNADPQEVAQVLQQLASGAQAGQQQGAGRGRNAPGQPQQPEVGQQTAILFSGDIKVAPDPATRSLVILASQSDFFSLEPVIEQLDAERKSIYLEVYLLELAMGRTLEGGAAGHFGATFDTAGGQGLGFVASAPNQQFNSVLPGPQLLQGIVGGVLGPEVPGSGQFLGIPGRDIPAFGVIIQALETHNDVNVVAEPHMYAADNQEAVIEVGRNVPTPGALSFPGGGQGGGLVPVQSIQREDVTLRVTITPHINDDRTVTLDVEMENRDIESIDPVRGVTTTKRRLKLDKIVARNDLPLVLGGLVRENERETVQQVPGLGSIPLLGWLFKRKLKQREKTNLLMILVPHIINTPDEVRRIHARRAQERMDFLRQTSFKEKDLDTNVNYRNKKGLLAAVQTEAQRMEQDAERYQLIQEELRQQVITGEIGMSPRPTNDEPAEGGDQPAPPVQPSTVPVGRQAEPPRPQK